MDLLAFAVPFFLLAIVLELTISSVRKLGLFRANDAINSLSLGILNGTFGYFTKFVQFVIWGFVLQNFALVDMPVAWFDASPRGVALWVIAILAWDFCYYWFHRFSHEISILWAAHAVHHQSEDYNLSTALRQTSSGFLFGWIFYLPLFVIGFPLEILITVNAINLIYQFWVHTQVVQRLGVLDYVLVTPSNHRVHHAQNERYIDKNYGGMLILWDRVFGTFADERADEPVIFGVRKALANWNPFWANLQVYDYLLFDAMRTRRWRDKLGIWFRRTGWRPDDVATRYPKKNSDLSNFEKYDPSLQGPAKHYLMAQFVVSILAVLGIGQLYVSFGVSGVFAPCLLLWAQLYALSLISEGRSTAFLTELLRLVVIVPLGVLALLSTAEYAALGNVLWVTMAGYQFVSLAWLVMIRKVLLKQQNIQLT
jgi:sterol desaturase/sphingolipid hydroxylase (fatty acid hydroxylase superfamily)